MNPAEHLDKIENCAKGLVNRCIAFANEKDPDFPETRLFRLYAAYVVAVDALTQGIKSSSSEFMDELKNIREEKKDVRSDNL